MTDVKPYQDFDIEEVATTLLETSRFGSFRFLHRPARAAMLLRDLWSDLQDALADLQFERTDFGNYRRREEERLRDARKDALKLSKRIDAALTEMGASKGRWPGEKPVAVVLSPYQYEELTLHGYDRFRKGQQYSNVSIYTAKGFYGPAVLTQDAFNAVTRMAPELNFLAKDLTRER
jgi:hypothetical protein